MKDALRQPALALFVGALLLSATGCAYNDHHSFGATEKWVQSDHHMIVRSAWLPMTTVVDAAISPVTMIVDEATGPTYHEDHRYLSYAGSRTIARSNMGLGYQWVASLLAFPIETVWFVIAGPVDLVRVLCCGDDQD